MGLLSYFCLPSTCTVRLYSIHNTTQNCIFYMNGRIKFVFGRTAPYGYTLYCDFDSMYLRGQGHCDFGFC